MSFLIRIAQSRPLMCVTPNMDHRNVSRLLSLGPSRVPLRVDPSACEARLRDLVVGRQDGHPALLGEELGSLREEVHLRRRDRDRRDGTLLGGPWGGGGRGGWFVSE